MRVPPSPKTTREAAAAATLLPPLRLLPHQETHHRVANSLQLVAALLSAQQRDVSGRDAQEALLAAAQRIIAIATVHRFLYKSEDEGRIAIAEYLRSLRPALEEGCARGGAYGTVRVEADPALVTADFALGIGIIATELVTNASKHAYEPALPGNIEIRFAVSTDHRFQMEVEDFGGVEHPVETFQSTGLGSQIIEVMARKLGARYSYLDTATGTQFVMEGVLPLLTG